MIAIAPMEARTEHLSNPDRPVRSENGTIHTQRREARESSNCFIADLFL
jgi:hypothetical protein